MARPIALALTSTPFYDSGESGRVTFTNWQTNLSNEIHLAVNGLNTVGNGCYGLEIFYGQDESTAVRADLQADLGGSNPTFFFQTDWPGVAKYWVGALSGEAIEAPYLRVEVSLWSINGDSGIVAKDRVGLAGIA